MTNLDRLNRRLWRLFETTLSKKIIAATLSGYMVYTLIMQGKFGVDWLGPATAFGVWMTFVGHVFNIDLRTKEIFPQAVGLGKPQEVSDNEPLYR